MKICIVTEYFPNPDGTGAQGGVEMRAWYLARELGTRHDISIVTSYQGPHQKRLEKTQRFTVHRVGPPHRYTSHGAVFSRLRFAASLYRFFTSQFQPCEIVDAQCFIPYLPSFCGFRGRQIVRISTWQEVWGRSWIRNKGLLTGTLGYLWERLALSLAWDAIITPATYTATILRQSLRSRTPVRVVPNGIDVKAIRAIAAGPRIPYSICAVGRLVHTKQIDTLLRAIAYIKATQLDLYENLKCNIVGAGPCGKELQSLSQSVGITDKVTFLGTFKRHQDVVKVIKENALLVHPSVVEGFGLVLAEAAACGTPFLASDIPILREVRELLNWGELFPPRDYHALADSISKCLSGKQSGQPESRVAELDWERIAAIVEEVYLDRLQNQ